MRRSLSERLYADRKCADGMLASGWRKVKKGGRVKFAGSWYSDPKLAEIVGELVNVAMGEYWCSFVYVSRGAIGCVGWFCNANSEEKEPHRSEVSK